MRESSKEGQNEKRKTDGPREMGRVNFFRLLRWLVQRCRGATTMRAMFLVVPIHVFLFRFMIINDKGREIFGQLNYLEYLLMFC